MKIYLYMGIFQLTKQVPYQNHIQIKGFLENVTRSFQKIELNYKTVC